MKAAVFHGARDIRVEDIPDPKVEPDGIIIRVRACGICGSDLHPYRIGGPAGMIFGHECSGDVVEVGANVTGIKEGQRVTTGAFRVCQQCYWCKHGQWINCPHLVFPGPKVPGALAEYVSIPIVLPGVNVADLPDTLTHAEGATVEPLSIGLYSVTKAQPKPEDTVVVIGAGMIGLCVIQVLKTLGVSQVIVSGRRPKRLQLAKESGADVVVDAAQEDIVSVVRKLRPERLADIVIECAGSPTTFQQTIQVVHNGGKVVMLGIYEQPITWNPNTIIGRNITLIGCLGENFPGSIDLLHTGKANTKPLITHEFPLDQVKEAFEVSLQAQDAVKVLVKP